MNILNAGKILLGGRINRTLTGPFFVQIGICNSCNYRCVMCWDHPSFIKKEDLVPRGSAVLSHFKRPTINYTSGNLLMSMEQYSRLIDELASMGTSMVKICGHGEPLLNKNAVEMVKYTTSRKISCHIVSNGSLLTEETIKGLSAAGLARLHISLNAASGATYSKIHLGEPEETFARIVGILKAVKGSVRMQIQLSFVVSSLNYHELRDFISLASECGASRIVLVLVTTYKQTEDLRLSPLQQEELKTLLEGAIALAERLGVKHNLQDLKKNIEVRVGGNAVSTNIYDKVPCYAGWYFSQINADGAVTPCCECINPLGNINKNSFREIWHSPEYETFRKLSKSIPSSRKFPSACRCNDCGFQLSNMTFERVLHPFSRSGSLAGLNLRGLLKKTK